MLPQAAAGDAEHQAVELRVGERPFARRPSPGRRSPQPDRRSPAPPRRDAAKRRKPSATIASKRPGHPAEERVERLGGGADLGRQRAGPQRLGPGLLRASGAPPRAGAARCSPWSGFVAGRQLLAYVYNGVTTAFYATIAFDVVVVGARCAGSPLATHARPGRAQRLPRRPGDLSQRHRPRPTGSNPAGVEGPRAARRAGAGSPESADPIEDADPGLRRRPHRGAPLRPRCSGAPMLNVRRVTLDAILLEAAAGGRRRGPDRDGREGPDSNRRPGRRGRDDGGRLRAPLVVGADGARSTIAAPGRARPSTRRRRRAGSSLWAYFEGVELTRKRLARPDRRARVPGQPDRRRACSSPPSSCRSTA